MGFIWKTVAGLQSGTILHKKDLVIGVRRSVNGSDPKLGVKSVEILDRLTRSQERNIIVERLIIVIVDDCTSLNSLSNLFSRANGEDPAGIYLLKVNNRNTRIKCEICSKLTIKKPERRQWHALF